MAITLKIRKVGNSLGVILPKEVLTHLNVTEGDKLTVTQEQDGVRLHSADPGFAKSMQVFESLNRRYRNALSELAK